MSAVPAAAPAWQTAFLSALKHRNALDACVGTTAAHCTELSARNDALRSRCYELDSRLAELRRHAASKVDGDGSDSGSGSGLETRVLEQQLRAKERELYDAHRLKNEAEKAKSELSARVAVLDRERSTAVTRAEQAEQETQRLREAMAEAKRASDDLLNRNRELQRSDDELRRQMGQVQDEKLRLIGENQQLLQQLIAVKQSKATEMNEMNALLDKLQRELAVLRLRVPEEDMTLVHSPLQVEDHGTADGPDALDRTDTPVLSRRYLAAPSTEPPTRLARTLPETQVATAFAFDESGTRILVGGADGHMRLYDTGTGSQNDEARLIRKLAPLGSAARTVLSVACSSQNLAAAAVSDDKSLRVWSMRSGRLLATLTGHTNKVYSLAFVPPADASVASPVPRVPPTSSSSSSGKKPSLFRRMRSRTSSIASSRDDDTDDLGGYEAGSLLVSGSNDRTIRIWDIERAAVRRKLPCSSSCNAVALMRDGDTIASAHLDSTVCIWSRKTGETVAKLSHLHTGQTTCVDFARDGSLLAVNSRDNSISIVDTRTWRQMYRLTARGFSTRLKWSQVSLSPCARYVCAGSGNGRVYVWRIDGQAPGGTSISVQGQHGTNSVTLLQQAHSQLALPDAVTYTRWSPLSSTIAAACKGKPVVLFE